MITRTLDATYLNEVLNHPDVHPWMGVEGPIDMSGIALNPDNYVFITDGGGFVAYQQSPCVYEVHSQFLKEKRGKPVADFATECLDYMFTRTNCKTLLTQVPDNNIAAKSLAVKFNWRPVFRREDTPRGPTEYYKLELSEWVQNTKALEADGEWFHDKLEKMKEQFGCTSPSHPHDPAHERAVGATVRMIKANNPFKAVDYYNSWANFAGYMPITILNECPIVIDVVDAVVEVRDGDMEFLLCR